MAEKSKTHLNRAKRQDELSHEQLVRADLLIRQTHEKQQVLFLKLQQTLVEVQELRAEVQAVLRALRLALAVDRETEQPIDFAALKQISHVFTKPL